MIIKYIITLVFIIFINPTRCSIVFDELTQKSNNIAKYCHKQRYCREGTHVVCMYYDDNHVYGPRCEDPVDVEVTPKMIQKILADINDIRGEVATGRERGKDDEVLPRAYGLMKLEWDNELAFFAQVLANQCLGGKGDLCRGTERFPNPSQTIAIVRYKYPNWEYLKRNNTEKGLNEEKLLFAVDKFFKSTHALKKAATKDIIVNCPSLEELPDINLRLYLNLIRGGATHIGCGASAYSSYKKSGASDSMHNNVQIVCNISDSPRSKQSVYKIIPPIPGQGFTKRCGCPIGYKETRSCLCERDTKFNWKEKQIKNQLKADLRTKIKNYDEPKSAVKPNLSYIHASSEKIARQTNGIKSPHTNSKSRNIIIIKGNNSKENHPEINNEENIESSDELSKITNALKFKKNSRLTSESDGEQNHKKISKPAATANAFEDLIFKVRTYKEKETTTERTLDVAKENFVDNHYTNKKTVNFKVQGHQIAHKKLLSILYSLEQEVKHLKFDDDLKQIFDLKMRKIYETGVNSGQGTAIPRALDEQLNKKDLHELRKYLQTETNESIEDEIASLRRMVHRLSKGAQKEHKITYAEIENNPNHNYKYLDKKIDEHYGTRFVNNMDNSNEDISKKIGLGKHGDYNIKFNDILNSKHNIDHQHDHTYNIKDNPETRNQETYNNARESILSKAIQQGYNLDNQDDEKIELERSTLNKIIQLQQEVERNNKKKNIYVEGRHLDNNKNYKSAGRRTGTISDRRLQLSNAFSRRNKNGEIRQILLRRPNQMDLLRISINQPGESKYPSERETFMF